MSLPRYWITHLVLLVGVAVRVGLWWVQPAPVAYDDHFTPIMFYAEHQRIPRAEDCWQCYQPPLYYALSGQLLRNIAHMAEAYGVPPDRGLSICQKSVQAVSLLAGCLTLYVILAILRRTIAPAPLVEAAAIGVISALPQHVYMSAMITNDAFTYLVASLAVWVALVAFGGPSAARTVPTTSGRAKRSAGGVQESQFLPIVAAGAAGLLAGAAVLSKGYGLVTVLAILLSAGAVLIVRFMRERRDFGRRVVLPLGLFCVGAVATGLWPAATNLSRYGRWHVDNYEVHNNGMLLQPPSELSRVDFLSFRFAQLLAHPWMHVAHLDSFWTALYARTWFDYEGIMVSLRLSENWHAHAARVSLTHPAWTRERWRALLNWNADAVPSGMARSAAVAYVAGLPLTAFLIAGGVLALRRFGRDFAMSLALIHGVGGICVPLFQTIRLPLFSAMKAAFTLVAIASAPVLIALALDSLRGRWQTGGLLLCVVAAVVVQATNVWFILEMHRMVLSL